MEYFCRQTPTIKTNLEKLEVLRQVIDLLPALPHLEENLRRESLLKSSLYSARIEGNRLKLEDINYVSLQKSTKDIEKVEVANILKALHWLYSGTGPKKISQKVIFKLHKFVMLNLSPEAGHFRKELSAIFNQAGIAIYLTPPPSQISQLMNLLIKKINSNKQSFSSNKEHDLVKAAVAHFTFEKIHPFLDGNGRVGRLLATFILKNSGLGFRGLVSLEEYFDKNRQDYYDLLANSKKDITDFVEFFLAGLVLQAGKAIERMKDIKIELTEDSLLPRRREILEIVKDHKLVTFDFLKRRFAKVPQSTLHYDLKQLLEKSFIKKLGITRGVLYKLKV